MNGNDNELVVPAMLDLVFQEEKYRFFWRLWMIYELWRFDAGNAEQEFLTFETVNCDWITSQFW